MHDLARHQQERHLVSIRRDRIVDDGVQGFVLAVSPTLVAIQQVDDFRLDGLMVLRLEDITEVRRGDSDQFQQALLAEEGLVQQVPFGMAFDLSDWSAVITQLSREHGYLILEREANEDPDFAIGRVIRTTADAVRFKFFSVVAHWKDIPEEILFEDITCCEVDTNYLTVYRRHFERQGIEPAAK